MCGGVNNILDHVISNVKGILIYNEEFKVFRAEVRILTLGFRFGKRGTRELFWGIIQKLCCVVRKRQGEKRRIAGKGKE